jgi:hypothetical protein
MINLKLNFDTNKKSVNIAFYDNYKDNKTTFKIDLPIILILKYKLII